MQPATGDTAEHDSSRSVGGAVICVLADGQGAQVARALEEAGFAVLAEVERGLELLPAVADNAPDVVVLDVALVGALGLRLLGLIKNLTPNAAVVVLTPLPSFDATALAAGAYAVVPADDLRRLRGVLADVAVSRAG